MSESEYSKMVHKALRYKGMEITDAMVERAVECLKSENRPGPDKAFAEWILEAALNPEPEIPVSEGMIMAAKESFDRGISRESYTTIYRAMEEAKRREEGL